MIRKILFIIVLLSQLSHLTLAAEKQPLQEKFQNLIKKYGYVIYDLKENSDYYEIYTTQNITFKLFNSTNIKNLDFSNVHTINLMKETGYYLPKPLPIYYLKDVDSYNRVVYYIDYSTVDKNYTNLEDYIKNFTKFENSLNLSILRITDRCRSYNVNCDTFVNFYTNYFYFKLKSNYIYESLINFSNNKLNLNIVKSNNFESDYSFYNEFFCLLFIFYIYYLVKFKLLVYKKNKYLFNLNLEVYFYTIILFSLYIIFRLLLYKIDSNFIGFTFSCIFILLFYLKNSLSKLARYQIFVLIITLISICTLITITYFRNNCVNFDSNKEFGNNFVRFTYKDLNICGKSLFKYPDNFNDQVPIIFNNYLIYHPKYKNISNYSSSSFDPLTIQEDSFIYSTNEDEIISFLFHKYKELQNKLGEKQPTFSNTIITNKKELNFSVYCNKDINNQKIVINEFYKLNESNNYKRVTTNNLITCSKNQKLEFNTKFLLENTKIINIQDSNDFGIIIESGQGDLSLNMYLYSNSVFFPSKSKTDTVFFYSLKNIKNLNFNWEAETYNNSSKRKLYIESLSNSIVKDALKYNVEISTLQPNSIFYNSDLGY